MSGESRLLATGTRRRRGNMETRRWPCVELLMGVALLVGCALACKGKPEAAEAREYLASLGKRYTPKELADTTALLLKETPVTDEGVAHLRTLRRLRFLSLEATQVTDAGLARLAEFPSLEVLDLARDPISDAGLVHIGKLVRLRGLGLAGTKITDAGLSHLAGLGNLTALHLAHTGISDAGLAHLHGLGRLQKINISDSRVTDGGVAALEAARPGIEVVRRTEPLSQPK